MNDFESDLQAAMERCRALGLASGRRPTARPALLIVDMMEAFTSADSPIRCDADEAVAATARLLEVARAHGRPVAYTRGEYDDGDLRAAASFVEKVPALSVLGVGSRWAQVDERLAPADGELVLVKLLPSAFFGTPLAAFLQAEGCDAVVCVGTSTSGCVRATVVDAMQHGLRVFVPLEAVADRDDQAAKVALSDIDTKYGYVVSTDEAAALLAG